MLHSTKKVPCSTEEMDLVKGGERRTPHCANMRELRPFIDAHVWATETSVSCNLLYIVNLTWMLLGCCAACLAKWSLNCRNLCCLKEVRWNKIPEFTLPTQETRSTIFLPLIDLFQAVGTCISLYWEPELELPLKQGPAEALWEEETGDWAEADPISCRWWWVEASLMGFESWTTKLYGVSVLKWL